MAWLGRISSWADEGLEVAFVKNGDFVEVFSKSDGSQIGKILNSSGGDAYFEAVAEGILNIGTVSGNVISSSKVIDIPVRVPCGDEISGALIAKTHDGTIGIISVVPGGFSPAVTKALTNPYGKLRGVLKANGLVTATEQGHHLIPIEGLRDNAVVQSAIEGGFEFNGLKNGMGLDRVGNPPRHLGSHQEYNDQILDALNDWSIDPANANYSPIDAKNYLDGMTDDVRETLVTSTGPINALDLGL